MSEQPIKHSISNWAEAAEQAQIPMHATVENQEVAAGNTAKHKKERAEAFGLPQLAIWGPSDDFDELRQSIPEEARAREQFVIRCQNKQTGRVERSIGISWQQVEDFVQALPGGKEQYSLRVQEYLKPDLAGTIIANGKGKIVIEIVRGDAYNIDAGKGIVMTYHPDTEATIPWPKELTIEERQAVLSGLEYVTSVTREDAEHLKIYAEFNWRSHHSETEPDRHWFFDVSDDDFWTNI